MSLLTRFLRTHQRIKSPSEYPSVSILRPLKGLDQNLEGNLTSTFEQTYPNFEIICSVETESDPAREIFEKLQKKYPLVKSKIIIGIKDIGVNPKINNLIKSYTQSKSTLLWFLDSNVSVSRDILLNSVDYFQEEDVGCVHHIPVGIEFFSLGAALEAVYMNCYHCRIYTFFNFLNTSTSLIGKSNIFRKQDLEEIGGLAYFSKYLGEDGMISQKLHDIGKYKVVGSDFVFQHIGSPSVMDFVNRRIRWLRVRKQVNLSSTILEPLSESIVNCILMAMYFKYYFGWEFRFGFLGMLLFWFCSDLILTSQIYSTINLKLDVGSYLSYCFAWVIREVFALPLYMWGMSGSEIQWRDKKYILHMNGEVKTRLLETDKVQVKEMLVKIMDKDSGGIKGGKDLLPKGA